MIQPEGYFAFLQYENMQHAVSASADSMRTAKDSINIAKRAFYISIILGLISLGLGALSYFSSKTINVQDTQIRELIQVTDQVKKNNEKLIILLEDIGFDIKQVLTEKDSIYGTYKPKK